MHSAQAFHFLWPFVKQFRGCGWYSPFLYMLMGLCFDFAVTFRTLDRFINEDRNAVPREGPCFARVTYSCISILYRHLFLFYLKIESMRELCCCVTQIELRTFVSSSSPSWTANGFLQIRALPSTNEGDYSAEKGFIHVQCQHGDRVTYSMDIEVPSETAPDYGRLSLGFYFSVALTLPGGSHALPLLLVSELICPCSASFTWLNPCC